MIFRGGHGGAVSWAEDDPGRGHPVRIEALSRELQMALGLAQQLSLMRRPWFGLSATKGLTGCSCSFME